MISRWTAMAVLVLGLALPFPPERSVAEGQDTPTPPTPEDGKAFLDQKEWYGTITVTLHGSGTTKARPQDFQTIDRSCEATVHLIAGPGMVGAHAVPQKLLDMLSDPNLNAQAKQAIESQIARLKALATTGRWMPDLLKTDSTLHRSIHDSLITPGDTTLTEADEKVSDELVNAQLIADTAKGTYKLDVKFKNEVEAAVTHESAGVPPSKSKLRSGPSAVLIENQPLPKAGTTCAGSRALTEKELGSIDSMFKEGWVEGQVSWSLNATPFAPVELVLTIPQYEKWLPEPSLDAATDNVGSSFVVEADLVKKGGGAPDDEMRYLRLHLWKASRELGLAGNAPLNPPAFEELGDLIFVADGNSRWKVLGHAKDAAVLKDAGRHAEIKVGARDGGAYGILRGDAILKSGRLVDAVLAGKPTLTDIPIPRRTLPSRVADAWKKSRTTADDADDETDPPGDTTVPGDGLTFYEEYRGFFEDGKFIRANPDKKDLFICNAIKDPDFDVGIKYFTDATELEVHGKMKPGELRDRAINFNHASTWQKFDQHGVVIEGYSDLYLSPTAAALVKLPAYAVAYGPGMNNAKTSPKDYTGIVVSKSGAPQVYYITTRGGTATTLPNSKARSVAHELCHTVGLYHHGDPTRQEMKLNWFADAGPPLKVTENGIPIEVHDPGGALHAFVHFGAGENDVGIRTGGRFSGDEDCLMRYVFPAAYIDPKDPNVRVLVRTDDVVGLGLCTDGKGTGNNDTTLPVSRFGDAAPGRGNCKGQIVVNDKK